MPDKCDFGLIGLAVMGENLALNVESRGYSVAVFNRTVSKVDDFINGRAKGKRFRGCHSLEELVGSLAAPRKVMLMVKAGPAVDEFIEHLIPLLSPGDVIIDGGNTYFHDTERRTQYVESKGLLFIGTGRLRRRRRRAEGAQHHARRQRKGLAARQTDLPGDLGQGRAER